MRKNLWRPKALRFNKTMIRGIEQPNASILYYIIDMLHSMKGTSDLCVNCYGLLDTDLLTRCFGSCYERYIDFLLHEGIIESPPEGGYDDYNIKEYRFTLYYQDGHIRSVPMQKKISDAIDIALSSLETERRKEFIIECCLPW